MAYLKNARDNDEHGIEPLATETPDRVEFRIKPGATFMRVAKVESRPDGYTNVEGAENVDVTVTPPKFELRPVMNRGRTHPVPTTHLGVALASNKPIDLAEAGFRFYAGFFDKAEAEVLNI